jgi:hypothetical protein
MSSEAMLCFRLTTDTGTIIEAWELGSGEFELLFAEAHRPREVVYTVTLRLVEAELLAEKLAMSADALSEDVLPS